MKKNNKKGLVIVLSGFSGAGKGTIMKSLLTKYPDDYNLSISATTRKKRVGEEEGREYFFKSREEFDAMIENGEFLEYATFNDKSYGTPKSFVEKLINEGKDVILEIEVQGALQVKKIFPEAILLFVMTKDAKTLKERLIGRGTESEKEISDRLAISVNESKLMVKYDYLIVNDQVEDAVERVNTIIKAEHLSVNRSADLINNIQEDMIQFTKGDNK